MPLSDYLAQIRSICPKLTGKETNLFAKGLEVQILALDDNFACRRCTVGGGLCIKEPTQSGLH